MPMRTGVVAAWLLPVPTPILLRGARLPGREGPVGELRTGAPTLDLDIADGQKLPLGDAPAILNHTPGPHTRQRLADLPGPPAAPRPHSDAVGRDQPTHGHRG
ncbi:hypothetical protein [Streptomyces coeruleorubidus]|uniref:hypothetical protein n=1 Tax=Streptomyces coeruleorubidus TaxID=116188 RepID=UPI0036B7B0D0